MQSSSSRNDDAGGAVDPSGNRKSGEDRVKHPGNLGDPPPLHIGGWDLSNQPGETLNIYPLGSLQQQVLVAIVPGEHKNLHKEHVLSMLCFNVILFLSPQQISSPFHS